MASKNISFRKHRVSKKHRVIAAYLLLFVREEFPDAGKQGQPRGVTQVRGTVAELGQGRQVLERLQHHVLHIIECQQQ